MPAIETRRQINTDDAAINVDSPDEVFRFEPQK